MLEVKLHSFLNPGALVPAEAPKPGASASKAVQRERKSLRGPWVRASPVVAKTTKSEEDAAAVAGWVVVVSDQPLTKASTPATAPSPGAVATVAPGPATRKNPAGNTAGSSASGLTGVVGLRLKFFEGRVKQLEKEARANEAETTSLLALRQKMAIELEHLRGDDMAWLKERAVLKSTAERYRKEAEE